MSAGHSMLCPYDCKGKGQACLPCPHLKVEDEEGDVVFLGATGIVAGEIGDGMEQGVDETGGRKIKIRFEESCTARLAKFLLRRILGFKDAVGAEQAAVARTHGDFHG